MPLKSLVMISGGADSLYSILRELRETKNEVHAHRHNFIRSGHPDFVKRVKLKSKAEQFNWDEFIHPWLKANERPFSYSTVVSDYSTLPAEAIIVKPNTYLFMAAGFIAMNINASRVLTGHYKLKRYSDGSQTLSDIQKILTCTFGEDTKPIPRDFEWFCWPYDYDIQKPRTKKDIYDYLGDDLTNMTMSCASPFYNDAENIWEWCDNRATVKTSKGADSATCHHCANIKKLLTKLPDIRNVSDAK